MGNRCLYILYDNHEVSPTVYEHWASHPQTSIIRLKRHMDGRFGDVPYATARLVGLLHAKNPESNLSLGIWNTPEDIVRAIRKNLEEEIQNYSHGDEGVYVIDVRDFSWRHYG